MRGWLGEGVGSNHDHCPRLTGCVHACGPSQVPVQEGDRRAQQEVNIGACCARASPPGEPRGGRGRPSGAGLRGGAAGRRTQRAAQEPAGAGPDAGVALPAGSGACPGPHSCPAAPGEERNGRSASCVQKPVPSAAGTHRGPHVRQGHTSAHMLVCVHMCVAVTTGVRKVPSTQAEPWAQNWETEGSWADHQGGPLSTQVPSWVDPCQVSWLALPPGGHPQSPRTWGLEWMDCWLTRPQSSQGHKPLRAGAPALRSLQGRADLWPETAGPAKTVLVSSAGCPEGDTSPQHTHPPRDTPSASGSWWPRPATPLPQT